VVRYRGGDKYLEDIVAKIVAEMDDSPEETDIVSMLY